MERRFSGFTSMRRMRHYVGENLNGSYHCSMIFLPVKLKPAKRLAMGVDTYMYHKTTHDTILGLIDLPEG